MIRKKDFWIGAFASFSFFAFLAFAPISDSDKNQDLRNEIRNLYLTAQPLQFKVISSTVSLNQLKDHELVIVDEGTKKLVTRVSGSLFYVSMSSK